MPRLVTPFIPTLGRGSAPMLARWIRPWKGASYTKKDDKRVAKLLAERTTHGKQDTE